MSLDDTHGGRSTRRRSAVMSDVAALAGVSHQTVSRVLNNSPQVRPKTRERVLDAMRKLDYRPNLSARALVTGRSRTVGVVTFATTLFGPASTLAAVERAALGAGYFVTNVTMESLDRPALMEAMNRLRALAVDGVLVIAPQLATTRVLSSLPDDLPVVALGAGPEVGVAVAGVDQREGARLATQHLLDLGHRSVAQIAGPETWQEAQLRIDGWRAALDAAGASGSPVLRGDWSPRSGYELAHRLLAEREDLTAVFAANDQMALGALRALHELGRQVPGDVSVVGFDDFPEAEFFQPPLTTVRQDFPEMGRVSVELLVSEIEVGTRSTERRTITPQLVVRASTSPLRTP